MDRPKLPNAAPVHFIKEVVTELRKVSWPTREETIKLTLIVIVISVIVGMFIGGLDILLVKITSIVLKK
ncbi:preprotein translocase subunit SecE [Candidatus Gottesmanbacteria bacterium]|nr:preprotein translocase subunit SecE [Candidatus Gottesmanbacteria bacterium]